MTDAVTIARTAQEDAEVELRVAEGVRQWSQTRCKTECARIAQAYGVVRSAAANAFEQRAAVLQREVLAARSPEADAAAKALADAAMALADARVRAQHLALARNTATFTALAAVQLRELTRVRDTLARVCRTSHRVHPGVLVCDDSRSLASVHNICVAVRTLRTRSSSRKRNSTQNKEMTPKEGTLEEEMQTREERVEQSGTSPETAVVIL